jgi:acyl-CoA thioesterase-1
MKQNFHFPSRRGFLLRLFFSLAVLAPPALLADDAIRVACVGDSITYGSHIADRDKNSYPACLGRFLGSGYDVRNFGVSGATMLNKGNVPYEKQKAHADALAFKPDIVIIMLGTNDSKHPAGNATNNVPDNWQYKADYAPNYEAMIAEFRAANPSVKIYICDPTPCFPGQWGINNTTIHDEIIPMFHQVASDTRANVIALYDTFSKRKELFPDTVHPNAAGAQLMAAAIYMTLTGKVAHTNIP